MKHAAEWRRRETTMPTSIRFRALNTLLLLATCAGPAAAQPSDIDIYSGVSASSDRPNVMLVLDSSANWAASISGAANCFYKDGGVTTTSGPTADQGTKLGIEKCALYNVVDGLPVANSGGADNDALFNIAIVLMNEPNNNGGYPRKRFLPLTTNNKAIFKTLIASFNKNGDKGNNADYGQVLYEAYLYYKGMAPLNGMLGSEWDAGAVSGGNYVSPSGNSCGRNYIILIGNGSPQNSNPEKGVQALLAARVDADMETLSTADRNALKAKIINPTLGNDEANWSDEMARFMRRVDVSGKEDVQGIITHAVAVKKGPSDGDFPALMNSVANYGGGNYYEATSADVLVKALLDIFNQIQAVNSVFASVSLPVSVNARGAYLNQVYIGMFRPDGDGKPRWRGNLKQYQLGIDSTDSLFLIDANGTAAVSATTGFISPSAVSYWTNSSSFWTAQPMGTPPTSSDSPDGEVVEKGAIAQQLRSTYATSQTARKVYTCIGCGGGSTLGGSSATEFNVDNSLITEAMLGVTSTTDRSNLINWVRGANNAGDEVGPTTSPATTVRPSIHGDVLHSRPAVVNFGGSTGVVVFYGANDGQLRAVRGDQSGTSAGEELWSFVPQEHFGKLNRLRKNSPDIQLSTTPAGLGALPRDYFVDGPIGVYQKLGSAGAVERVIVFVGMRRGGRQVYALDVTAPASPKFLWKVTNATSGMSLLGQTWSEPKAARVKGVDNPVVIFGGGYDAAAEDSDSTATMGNSIYVLDALTGAVLKTFTTLSGVSTAENIGRSVAADVTLIDADYDGKVDRAYAADLGGQLYRIDFESDAGNGPADWTVFKVANLAGGTSTGRKFFYAPDVVLTKDFAALMIGSGDREKPLLSATQDHFFQVFDRRKDKGAPTTATPVVWDSLTAMSSTASVAGSGCYMALAQGEKVVNGATSIAGFSYFGTNRPSSTSSSNICSANLGVAKGYAMPLFCVAATGSVFTGGGLPPSPVSGIVRVTKADGTTEDRLVVIGGPNSKGSVIEASQPRPVIEAPRRRRYWFQETQR
jgi:type IV pilus assembly protein PilY1